MEACNSVRHGDWQNILSSTWWNLEKIMESKWPSLLLHSCISQIVGGLFMWGVLIKQVDKVNEKIAIVRTEFNGRIHARELMRKLKHTPSEDFQFKNWLGMSVRKRNLFIWGFANEEKSCCKIVSVYILKFTWSGKKRIPNSQTLAYTAPPLWQNALQSAGRPKGTDLEHDIQCDNRQSDLTLWNFWIIRGCESCLRLLSTHGFGPIPRHGAKRRKVNLGTWRRICGGFECVREDAS